MTKPTQISKEAIEILSPTNPGSVYHMTKTHDQRGSLYYNKNDGVWVTGLHQSVCWAHKLKKPNSMNASSSVSIAGATRTSC